MITLIRNVELFSPASEGLCHLVLSGGLIETVLPATTDLSDLLGLKAIDIEDFDARGMIATPGFVDSLVHFAGGGGEGGFGTRIPELLVDEALRSGTTTFVGALGTDSVTRTLSNVLAKCREFQIAGLSAYMYTGSYHLPAPTLTGSVSTDLLYIPEVIGLGELAIADHRASQLSTAELARIASQTRVSGMLAGKRGIVFCHLGDGEGKLSLIEQVVEQTDIPIHQFYPTHINRTQTLMEAGFEYIRKGGVIDFTASTTPELLQQGEISCVQAFIRAQEKNLPLSQITFSSDANASLPEFDAEGDLVGLKAGRADSLFSTLREAVLEHKISLEAILPCITSNPARILGLNRKGHIKAGWDADITLIDPKEWQVAAVWSGGKKVL